MHRLERTTRKAAIAAQSSWLPLGVAVALLIVALGPARATTVLVSAVAGASAPLLDQTAAQAQSKSAGCLSCHVGIDEAHASPAVKLGCTDCHGGDPGPAVDPGVAPGSDAYRAVQDTAHIQPTFLELWLDADGRQSSANPVRSYAAALQEAAEFIRFINPGDLRVAQESCGGCHPAQVAAVRRSPMTTSAIFWVAAAYANGIVGQKAAFMGEIYGRDGDTQRLVQKQPLTPRQEDQGALTTLVPLPRWQTMQPGEYFRAFERGGILNPSSFPEIGNPNRLDEPGRPDIRLSNRGPGTGLRISPALINLHKTRLNDPHLSFLGTNDHPGDYRSSGCSACHVVYANDRDPVHSGPYAGFGHLGQTASSDRAICGSDPLCANRESGHPIQHRLTRAIPTSQCMSCHLHQPNSFVNTFLGYTMWDYETDAELLWPKQQRYPTETEKRASLEHNPEGAAVRGLWSDPDFLANVRDLNPMAKHTQFADYHGHGWVFRAVFKRDRAGNLLDADDLVVPFEDPERFGKAVHLRDIHAERGMHCVDCHFSRDAHGDGLIHGEYGNAIEIECQDCHGTIAAYTDLRTTGPAAPPGGTRMVLGTTPFGQRRFAWAPIAGGTTQKLVQRSMLDPEVEWTVPQIKDSVTAGHPRYNQKAAYAKTLARDGAWGEPSGDPLALVHRAESMTCSTCHSAWITACSGCHLPQEANVRSKMNHYEGETTRNYASYNPQVIRTDLYMLGIGSSVKGNRVSPVRSSSALVLSSTNANRKRFYQQQPPISAPGYSSQAFNPHAPHTVRTRETKRCSDCHLSQDNDNNAWMAQLLTQGTNFVNFIGHNVWVGEGKGGFEAITATEWDEPQAVIGSSLHKIVYPDFWARHQARDLELEEAHHHGGGGEIRSLQLRGEYLFAAKGPKGLEVFDVANVGNADFSERIVTAPVSPLGQRTSIKTRFATAVALPTTMPVAAWRQPMPENQELPLHPIYRYAFVSDRYEGLIAVNVDTLTDADPTNNFFERAVTFDAGGELRGAENLTVAGNNVYLAGAFGLAVVDASDPLAPQLFARLPELGNTTAVAVQLRYAFVTGERGLAVVDVTDPRAPKVAARLEEVGAIHNLYVARTYAYLAAGARGLVIVDITRPDRPRVDREWNAEGRLRDTRDVKVGSTNSSAFAYLADGEHGLVVAQLTSPEWTPGYLGWSPRPDPRLVATRHTHGPALAISKGLDRDRAADESGNQVSIFNRIGSRPLNGDEMRRLLLRDGKPFFVSNDPPPGSRSTPAHSQERSP